MSAFHRLMNIGTLVLAVLILMAAGPVFAADYTGGGIVGSPTVTAAPGTTPPSVTIVQQTPVPAPAPTAPGTKATYFSGSGGSFSLHQKPVMQSEAESLEAYRIKNWRENYVRAMKKQRAEKAALKKRSLKRLYPVSALASIQP